MLVKQNGCFSFTVDNWGKIKNIYIIPAAIQSQKLTSVWGRGSQRAQAPASHGTSSHLRSHVAAHRWVRSARWSVPPVSWHRDRRTHPLLPPSDRRCSEMNLWVKHNQVRWRTLQKTLAGVRIAVFPNACACFSIQVANKDPRHKCTSLIYLLFLTVYIHFQKNCISYTVWKCILWNYKVCPSKPSLPLSAIWDFYVDYAHPTTDTVNMSHSQFYIQLRILLVPNPTTAM